MLVIYITKRGAPIKDLLYKTDPIKQLLLCYSGFVSNLMSRNEIVQFWLGYITDVIKHLLQWFSIKLDIKECGCSILVGPYNGCNQTAVTLLQWFVSDFILRIRMLNVGSAT